ncbi:hypothetical protein FIBSPDRAFT_551 [Athelia psychrophila]|uniref:Secreted protein n=1 Tax=Athelia psychrophila TaxID=1759441 RepID=A0A166WVT5_9AGAM|nr:hypothetical protein FIBSPDRAFT_551 [Fibularhizoctonia sp. CBS 109695]
MCACIEGIYKLEAAMIVLSVCLCAPLRLCVCPVVQGSQIGILTYIQSCAHWGCSTLQGSHASILPCITWVLLISYIDERGCTSTKQLVRGFLWRQVGRIVCI